MRFLRHTVTLSVIVHAALFTVVLFAHDAFQVSRSPETRWLEVVSRATKKSLGQAKKFVSEKKRKHLSSERSQTGLLHTNERTNSSDPHLNTSLGNQPDNQLTSELQGPSDTELMSATKKDSTLNAESAYLRRCYQIISDTKVYPLAAKKRALQGTVLMELTIEKNGVTRDIHLLKGSGVEMLDRAAESLLAGIRRFPPTPDGAPVTFQIPIRYTLN